MAKTTGEYLPHNYDSVVTEPTCEEHGYTTHTCSRCEDSYVDSYVEALGHTEIIDDAVEPTCTETGLTQGSHCEVCDKVLIAQEVVDALGHDYDSVVTNPTCEEQGYTTHTCSRCEDSYVDSYVEALGHTESDWIIDKEATHDHEGHKHTECITCGKTIKNEIIEKIEKKSSLGLIVGLGSAGGVSIIGVILFIIFKRKRLA